MRELAVRMHGDAARMAELVAAFADSGYWREGGMRSCADWVMANLGFDRYTTDKLLRAGVAARTLPAVAEAFSAGELSLDSVGMLSTVATAEDQGDWVEVARKASPPQLARRCREAHRAAVIDAPDRARAQRAQRSLRTWWDELGMLQLRGALPPEDGARFRGIVEKMARRLAAERPADPDTAADPGAALRADALVAAVCGTAALGGGDAAPAPPQLVVHVDLGVLTGETPDGRCHILDGPALSAAAARRLGCDANLVMLVERDGQTVGSGRERPVVTARMRRVVQSRDGTCRYPGCPRPATQTHAHHIHHRVDGGPTRLWNLLSLCEYHHNRHHLGEYDIRRTDEVDLCFETHEGLVLGIATGGCWRRPRARARAGPG